MNLEQCNRASSFAHVHVYRVSAASLSSLRFSPQCRHLHPSPPTLRLVRFFRVSMVVLACRRLCPNPAANLSPRPPPFLLGQSRLRPSRLGHATASPASLLPGQSRLSAPAPGPAIAIANNTFLVAVESFLSARMSQERRTRCRVGRLGRRRRH